MLKSGKEVWHKLNAVPQNPEVMVASERAFRVTADGKIHGRQLWTRGARTAGQWRPQTIKAESDWTNAVTLREWLRSKGFRPGAAPLSTLVPTIKTIMRWDWDRGGCEATDGCWVEPDGRCPHGAPAWSLVYGTI